MFLSFPSSFPHFVSCFFSKFLYYCRAIGSDFPDFGEVAGKLTVDFCGRGKKQSPEEPQVSPLPAGFRSSTCSRGLEAEDARGRVVKLWATPSPCIPGVVLQLLHSQCIPACWSIPSRYLCATARREVSRQYWQWGINAHGNLELKNPYEQSISCLLCVSRRWWQKV